MIFADFISDHGECIEDTIDRVDSERVAELVRQRLDTLNEKELGAIMAVYGDCFQNEKKTAAQYADEMGVSHSAVSYWLQKARWKILNNRKPLYQYMRDDEYYRPLLKKTSKKRTALEQKFKKKPRRGHAESIPVRTLYPQPPFMNMLEWYTWAANRQKHKKHTNSKR